MASNNQKDELVYEGSNFLRQRLVLSCISGKKIKITNIRSNAENIGITESEMSLVRLFDKISNGTKIQVNRTGTGFVFVPGVLLGGTITHDCHLSRGIGYYLEPMMMLAPFCKRPLCLRLNGITNCEGDISVDQLRYSLLQVLQKFMMTDDGLELILIKRGLPPTGGGIVSFRCPVRKELKPFQWADSGLVKKVRGVCFTRRVAPVISNRIIEEVKRTLHHYLTDVYFTFDNSKGPSPGFGITMNCVTTKGTYYSSESISCQPLEGSSGTSTLTEDDTETKKIKSAEAVGEEAVFRLLEQIKRGGCVDSYSQCMVLLFMVLGPKDVSKIVLGPLTTQSMYMLKHLKDFFSVTFKIDEYKPECPLEDDEEEVQRSIGDKKLVLTCVGTGFVNFSKGNI